MTMRERTTKLSVPLRLTGSEALAERMELRKAKIAKRAYELFEQQGRADGHDLEHWFQAEHELCKDLPVGIADCECELVLTADVHGVSELNVAVDPARVIIMGRTVKNGFNLPRGTREVFHAVPLQRAVRPGEATATLKGNYLEIVLPKAVVEISKAAKYAARAA